MARSKINFTKKLNIFYLAKQHININLPASGIFRILETGPNGGPSLVNML